MALADVGIRMDGLRCNAPKATYLDPIRLPSDRDLPMTDMDHHAATHERVLHSVPQAPNRREALSL